MYKNIHYYLIENEFSKWKIIIFICSQIYFVHFNFLLKKSLKTHWVNLLHSPLKFVLEIESWISDQSKFVVVKHRSAHKSLHGGWGSCDVHGVEECSSTYEQVCWHVVQRKINQSSSTHRIIKYAWFNVTKPVLSVEIYYCCDVWIFSFVINQFR